MAVCLSGLLFCWCLSSQRGTPPCERHSREQVPKSLCLTPRYWESSPIVNAIWGLANLFIGYVLIFGVGSFAFGLTLTVLMVALGALLTALALARHFGRVRGG